MVRRRFVLAVSALVALSTALPYGAPRFSDWSDPISLGPTVNSTFNDLAPALSKDGLSLYFQSNRPGGQGGLDIWVSQRAHIQDTWGAPVNLGNVVNSSATEGAPSFSRDGHWMFFNSNRPGGLGDTDIWVTWRAQTHDDFGWEAPFNLGPAVNSASGDGGVTFFQSDDSGETVIFFGSARPGGAGAGDIYLSTLLPDGSFTPAARVPELSSPQDDMGPKIRMDGLEIFQVSNRPQTFGARDLWVSERDTVFDSWSPPVNLGSIVNSASNELTPYLSSDRRILFFASDRPGGLGGTDLYATTRGRITGQ